jgi:hypothetical protein
MRQALSRPSKDEGDIAGLKRQAVSALDAGEFEEATRLLNVIRGLEREASERRLRAAEEMAAVILRARDAKDSVGGVVEVVARGVPAGWGDPTMDKLDARLAATHRRNLGGAADHARYSPAASAQRLQSWPVRQL